MERKERFEVGEFYHLYTRGVEKRIVFLESSDFDRFLTLLLICNDRKNVKMSNIRPAQRGFPSLAALKRDPLVEIFGYALMPNHVHLIVREKSSEGISKFMLKLMTAYSMYFNTKYDRSGPLFTRPFRSKHIDSDEYFRWVFAYTHLNPLELLQHNWKQVGITDERSAKNHMQQYRYSSYPDYFLGERAESTILSKTDSPFTTGEFKTMDDLLKFFSNAEFETKSLI